MKTLYRSDKHWNHYRIQSARASWWDYGKNSIYYVTICTKHRFPFFGQVEGRRMKCSKMGELARQLWMTLPEMSLPGVKVEALAISPNHIHGIIVLDRAKGIEPLKESRSVVGSPTSEDETVRKAFFQSISPKKGSLSHLIRKFKGLVTKAAREQGWLQKKEPLWQAGYYDRVVRDVSELDRIVAYLSGETYHWETRQDDYYIHQPSQSPSKQHQQRFSDRLKALYKKKVKLLFVGRNNLIRKRRDFQIELEYWLRCRFPNIYAPLVGRPIPPWKL